MSSRGRASLGLLVEAAARAWPHVGAGRGRRGALCPGRIWRVRGALARVFLGRWVGAGGPRQTIGVGRPAGLRRGRRVGKRLGLGALGLRAAVGQAAGVRVAVGARGGAVAALVSRVRLANTRTHTHICRHMPMCACVGHGSGVRTDARAVLHAHTARRSKHTDTHTSQGDPQRAHTCRFRHPVARSPNLPQPQHPKSVSFAGVHASRATDSGTRDAMRERIMAGSGERTCCERVYECMRETV